MDPKQNKVNKGSRIGNLLVAFSVLLIFFLVLPYFLNSPSNREGSLENGLAENDRDMIENGIHLRTGLKEGEGLMTVVTHCTACHSAKLVMQNRMNMEQWNATIRWMQKTQNLWELGENQKIIVDYLVTNYPPPEKGRRENLKDIEWYELKE